MAKKKPEPPPIGHCDGCGFKKGVMNKAKGKNLPGGGKCTYPGGFCPHRFDKKEGDLPQQAPETTSPDSAKPGHEVDLSFIYPNPGQPRKMFPQDALEELAQSIKEQGLIEPLVVVRRPREDREFMLVAGERRWKACKLAGLTRAPGRIIEATDDQVAEMALVENLQRQDLTPLEEAKAFQEMLGRGYSKEGLAQKLGFRQVWRIDERLSLLKLSGKFQEALVLGIIGNSQAFEMSRLEDHGDQEVVFHKIKNGELPTYNHLRRFVTAMLDARKQVTMFEPPKREEAEIVCRWEKALDAVTGLICKSFTEKDCQVMARVLNGNAAVNVQKIDMIIMHLNLMKKAMLENASKQEAVQLVANI